MITGMPRIAIAVHDFQAVVSLFRDKFGMPVIDLSKESIPEYGAALGMCVPEGGSNIELMSPVDPNTPLSKSLQGFLDRRGEGLFALMLEAPVPDDEAVVLANRGLNVMPLMPGAFGRDVHPSSTHGVLIRVYPVNSFVSDYRAPIGERDGQWVTGIKRVIIAVKDIDCAIEIYGTQFNMTMEATEIDVERGVYTAICRPEEGGVIELVAVDDSSRPFAKAVAEFLQKKREGMYALVLHASDISATQKMLVDRGLKVRACADSPGVLEVDQEATFGALLRIEAG
jgi:catechol 2,3-dioxygenase-like lactoylglutathione lyase family enzyme